jgi:hypothetical protein
MQGVRGGEHGNPSPFWNDYRAGFLGSLGFDGHGEEVTNKGSISREQAFSGSRFNAAGLGWKAGGIAGEESGCRATETCWRAMDFPYEPLARSISLVSRSLHGAP